MTHIFKTKELIINNELYKSMFIFETTTYLILYFKTNKYQIKNETFLLLGKWLINYLKLEN